jgi:aldehyde:ferredoxin oxidoreductase
MEKHVESYAQYFNAATGRNASPADLNTMSEAVYNFQRISNLTMGFGSREHDQIHYRAMGPVTVEEYKSCRDRYEDQLAEKYGADIAGKASEEKLALLRGFRQEQ